MLAGKRRRSDDTMATNLSAATAVAVSASTTLTFIGAHAALRSVVDRVQTALDNLAASTELRRQQIEQQRLLQHEASDGRAAALQALVHDESALRTSHLERQLVDADDALKKLREEQSVVRESPSDELTQRIAALPSVPVEADSVAVQLDYAPVLHAISTFGVVFGAQSASDVFDTGFALLLGRDGKKDAAEAFAMFTKSAAQGNTTAMGYAATLLFYGFGVKRDTVLRVKQMYTEAAARGDLYSRAMVIWLDKRAAEYGHAFSLLRHAASTGHVLAEFELGHFVNIGIGGDVDNKKTAAEWFRRSSDQGYAIAQYQLATCYYSGTGVTKNKVKAVALYRLAADQGYARAQFDVGAFFTSGKGVVKDPVQAAVWCQRAADQGHAEAQRTLAACFKNGFGVDKDVVQAAAWYRRAAEQGDAKAQNSLGLCYFEGKGVDKDPVQAAVWYARAAEQGFAVAQYNLGINFYCGTGVAKDFVQAVKWLTLAAAQNYASAHGLLGLCYTTGNGVAKSLVNALLSYQRAADLGDDKAKKDLEKIQAAFPA
jgi:TPR repeat protein